MELEFERYCECDLTKPLVQSACKCQQLLSEESSYWEKIFLILKHYQQPSKEKSVQLLFGDNVHQFKE